MRSVALLRTSLALGGIVTLAVAAAQLAALSLTLPVEQLRLAFTLSRVLIQL